MKKFFIWATMALTALALTMTFAACGSSDDDDDDENDVPVKGAVAETGAVSGLTWNAATIGGTVNLKELPVGIASVEFGVELAEDEGFKTPTRFATSDLDASGKAFSVEVTPLSPSTTYYYRTYVTAQSVNYYGSAKQFTTPEKPADVHEAVDLGLESGTLWATCNVGASAPEEAGDYFAWGETEPKDVYVWDTYEYYDKVNGVCINIGSDIAGTDYDVAHVKWQGDWRMPTREQCKELVENTTHVWTTQNGVNGRKFTSKVNGNSIFLPAAGYRWGSDLYNAGSYGLYWSSTLGESGPDYAYYLYFYGGGAFWGSSSGYRSRGRSVRPVRKN